MIYLENLLNGAKHVALSINISWY